MLTMLRRQADEAAQAALHALVGHYEKTGEWDRRLAAAYGTAEALLDLLDERIRDMADPEPEPLGLPDIPLADPGDHYAGMPS
jgi:hypothetical protein